MATRIGHVQLVGAGVDGGAQHGAVAHDVVLVAELRLLGAEGEEGLGEDVMSEIDRLAGAAGNVLVGDLRGLAAEIERADGLRGGVSQRWSDAVVLGETIHQKRVRGRSP